MTITLSTLSILTPALLAGLLVISTHVPLGRQVLQRGIVFIDLAIAQVAALGLLVAASLGWETRGIGVQAIAVSAALASALLLAWSERRWPDVQEALIGVLFILGASGALLILHHHPQGGEHLKGILEGQILWVSYGQLIWVTLVYAGVLALWFGLGARLNRLGFYALFAVTVTLSVQLVGVYLVFASLIIPPLSASRWPAPWRLPVAYMIGLTGYGLGVWLSWVWDWPTGATIVWSLGAVGMLVAACRLVKPQHA